MCRAWGWALVALASGLSACGRNREAPVDTAGLTRKLADIIATCATASGRVEVLRGGQSFWEPLAPGATFRSGDWVRTGAQASARIEFLGGGRLELEEDSVVLVERPPPAEPPDPSLPLIRTALGR
ncbi:hypothetical protein [Pyxidicoccus xibeiensis]|uniref:hypothetical protein n=1 Tax=Pyxidicoccus xibeiensis TaxID=2906759 RepID=UPI0020A75C0C|nr:hypothetical protein [Pyxidicoccus xibeiensis]MCP3143548.1 hypothetical protein [Pyxidicoccus xibeiensis]